MVPDDPTAAGPGAGTFDEAVARLARLAGDGPPRGDGRTLERWRVLARIAAHDLSAARLAEGHLDATTIVHELDPPATGADDGRWAVWAAASRGTCLRAERDERHGWLLSGTKPWCSGPEACTQALVTAESADGARLFAVALPSPGLRVEIDRDHGGPGLGMPGAAPVQVAFDRVDARAVGEPGRYLERPGFWHGAVAVAAVWFGGAQGVAAPLRRRAARADLDPHAAAHLGHVDAALAAARWSLRAAAAEIDDPSARDEPLPVARRRALQVRATVEAAVETTLRSTGRATGPGPLAHDRHHAQHVADLELYVRQSHAERDLETLGRLAGDDPVTL